MDRGTAVQLDAALKAASASLQEAVGIARDALDQSDFKSFALAVANVLAAIEVDVRAVWMAQHHPDLATSAGSAPAEFAERLQRRFLEAAQKVRQAGDTNSQTPGTEH